MFPVFMMELMNRSRIESLWDTETISGRIFVMGHPYMTSALRGGGVVSPKEDVVREVA